MDNLALENYSQSILLVNLCGRFKTRIFEPYLIKNSTDVYRMIKPYSNLCLIVQKLMQQDKMYASCLSCRGQELGLCMRESSDKSVYKLVFILLILKVF
jgi:hypothetical protein